VVGIVHKPHTAAGAAVRVGQHLHTQDGAVGAEAFIQEQLVCVSGQVL
jgi:hypothetical protein